MSTAATEDRTRTVKCVVWDLDCTIWRGVLLEDAEVTPDPDIVRAIRTLDERGILQSISSKNDPEMAMAKLIEFGLAEYFLCPAISWGPKSEAIRQIATALNLGIDALAFVDDQPFERDEVQFALRDVLCLDPNQVISYLSRPEFTPRFITDDAKARRLMYLRDIQRQKAEASFTGTQENFLATLGMQLVISDAQEEDLRRAEELTVRTHQLNATGYTYSYEELRDFLESPRHRLLIASLSDTYGSYGKIGLALIDCAENRWTLKLLLMSCRVMSRGVGTILLNHITSMAQAAGVRLQAEFVETARNRMMYVTFMFNRFTVAAKRDAVTILEHDGHRIQPPPPYVQVVLRTRETSMARVGL